MLGKTHKPTKPIYASVFLFCKVSIWVPSSWNHRPEESMCLLCSRLDQHSIKCMICWLMPHLTSPGRPSSLSVLVAILESPGRVWSWHPPHLGYFLLIVIFFFFMTVILVSFSQPPGHLPTELLLSNQKENPFAPLHPVLVGRWAVEAFITHLTLEQGTPKLHGLGFSGTVYFYFCPRILPSQDLQIVPRGLVFLYFFTI